MARFVLEPGEAVTYRQMVGNVRDSHAACELILTDRRIVLTATDTKPGWSSLFGFVGALLDRRPTVISHQFRREDFDQVTTTGGRDLRVESKGEGYARVLFDISTKKPEQLVERIHR